MKSDVISLEEIKRHCRIDLDLTEDDSLLEIYRDAALKEFELCTNRKLYTADEYIELLTDYYLLFNTHIKSALLILIGYWYENRETAIPYTQNGIKELPLTFSYMTMHYRFWNI